MTDSITGIVYTVRKGGGECSPDEQPNLRRYAARMMLSRPGYYAHREIEEDAGDGDIARRGESASARIVRIYAAVTPRNSLPGR